MLILMATRTRTRQAEVGVAQVFYLDLRARRLRNLPRVMALLAMQSGMRAGQWKAGLQVIYGLAVRLPANQREIRAVMIGVTLHAIFARPFGANPHRMHAAILRQTVTDLCVTVETLEFHSARAHVVAFRAAQNAGKRLVWLGERSGRYLRSGWNRNQQER
jgi:hypothetical protein